MCYKDGTQLPPLNITITCSEYGRYVIFYNERLVGNIYPAGYELVNVVTELCEVVVEGVDFHILKCQIHVFYRQNILIASIIEMNYTVFIYKNMLFFFWKFYDYQFGFFRDKQNSNAIEMDQNEGVFPNQILLTNRG